MYWLRYFREDIKVLPNHQDIPRTMTLITILVVRLYLGWHQTNGNIKGPAHKKPTTIVLVLKYHGTFSPFAACGGRESSRNSLQKRHLITSSWICSAQKGHAFICFSWGKGTCPLFTLNAIQLINQIHHQRYDDVLFLRLTLGDHAKSREISGHTP